MERIISKMLQDYEAGKLTRRELIGGLAAFASGTQLTAAKESTFRGVGLNHIAIRVTNIPRSRDFYQKHLGLPLIREAETNCFLGLGKNFLTLFKNEKLDWITSALQLRISKRRQSWTSLTGRD